MTSPDPTPTPYAVRAEEHWRRCLPRQYSKIPPGDRPRFFGQIGAEIEQRILARVEELTRDQPPPEGGYMDSLATSMTIAGEVKRQVLDEMLPAPEETAERETDDQEETADS